MSNGLRQRPQPSTKDKFRELDVELKNTQMASRFTQMMVQQMIQNSKSMGEDIGRLFQLCNELQYKFLALQEVTGASVDQLAEVAARLRLKDFEEASSKEDQVKGFTVIDAVEDDSTVILTSTTKETPDQGIFRSRVRLSETGSPELIQGLTGKGVGTKVVAKLNGVEHEVELLGIRKPPEEASMESLQTIESSVEQ